MSGRHGRNTLTISSVRARHCKLADLMVLSANPLQDIAAIRNLKMVFKGGNRIDTNPPEGQVDLGRYSSDGEQGLREITDG